MKGKEGSTIKEPQTEQKEELATLDWSILFLLLLIAGVLLSFSATVEQRNGLAQALCGQREETADVFSKRWTASILIVGTTGFFAWLACRSAKETQCRGDCADRRSAQANLLASILVFVAALIRLNDLELIGRDRQNTALEETLEPQ